MAEATPLKLPELDTCCPWCLDERACVEARACLMDRDHAKMNDPAPVVPIKADPPA